MSHMNLEDWEEHTEERRQEAKALEKKKATTPGERREAKRAADRRYRDKKLAEHTASNPTESSTAMDESPATTLAELPASATNGHTQAPAIDFTRTEWAGRINKFWREGRESAVAAIMLAGENLAASRANMESAEWLDMIANDLDMGRNTAQRLAIIGANQRLKTHTHRLPASWMTLYELTKLTDADFDALVQNGILRPEMERKEIAKALPQPAAPAYAREKDAEGTTDYGEPDEPREPTDAMIAAGARALQSWGACQPDNAFAIARDCYMAMARAWIAES